MFGLEFCEDPVHTIKCELLFFDAVLYASFYGGGIAPFIWTTINGCLKFGCDRVLLFAVLTLLDSMETWNFRRKKKQLYKDSLELFRIIYTINTFILLFCSYFCMYVLYLCLYFHV